MFTMMNSERLSVGTQGLGIGEASYQSAVAYARDRLQGRALSGAKYPEKAADPIIVHPDVRRSLMTMRAYNEGCRALSGWVARNLDLMERSNDPEERQQAEDFTALMTPIVKALFTDLGFTNASLGVQVYGGHGYIRDHGMEQYVRDARIAMIYEGTNGIQALDLVGRKLPAHTGRYLRSFFHPVLAYIDAKMDDENLGPLVGPLGKAFGALQLATGHIAEKGLKDAEEAGAAATDYLRLFGLVALGYMWVRMAEVAFEKRATANGEAAFYEAKIATARFFIDRLLPEVAGLWGAIKSGKSSMMALPTTPSDILCRAPVARPQFPAEPIMVDIDALIDSLSDRAGALAALNHTVRFDLTDTGQSIHLDATGTVVNVTESDAEAEAVLKLSTDTLDKLITGRIGPMMAFSTGRLRLEGSQGVALKLASLLDG